MEDKLMTFKAGVAAFFTALSAVLGWQGVMILVWVIMMLLDYLSGTFAAVKAGEWSSKTAREGLWHKGGMIIVVLVAGVTDLVLSIICAHLPLEMTWPVLVLPLVLAWYILTEMGSILENAVKLGAPIPEWLVKVLKVGVNILDRKGEQIKTELDMADIAAAEENGETLPAVGEHDDTEPPDENSDR